MFFAEKRVPAKPLAGSMTCAIPALRILVFMLTILGTSAVTMADGAGDNVADKVRRIPPAGVQVPDEHRATLQKSLDELNAAIAKLKAELPEPRKALLPDIEIFARAVDQALRFDEFFHERDTEAAAVLLNEGRSRAESLAKGEAPWTTQTGLVVRGFRSKLDDTVQPYGLVIPDDYRAEGPAVRCDVWLHGRLENTVELQFIRGRMTNRGDIAPPRTIVVHPFGRFSNAFKFAGEVDVWEALAHAQSQYVINPDRVSIRGFSMGGAGAWHFTVHYPDRFFASNPGAGFSETPKFLKVFQNEDSQPPEWERTLWKMYDCPEWVENLRMIPTIAYSGEIDKQKQAADVMAEACQTVAGLELTHIIGPKTAHQIHPDSKAEIERRLDLIARQPIGTPPFVSFTTDTLRYDRCDWVRIHGLDRHWSKARLIANWAGPSAIEIAHDGVSDFELIFDAGQFPTEHESPTRLRISTIASLGHEFSLVDTLPRRQTDRSWSVRVHREGSEWKLGGIPSTGLRKVHGLQGPIDDAFMGSFLFVKPSGKSPHEAVNAWVEKELDHAITHWRQQMRGDARVKLDTEVTAEDISKHNIVLWGDAASNQVLKRIAAQLPVKDDGEFIAIGDAKFAAAGHIPALIFPNPENPARYVVLNSSFTYREYDYLNNARQTPKLPDWAVIDVTTGRDSRSPGKVVAAGFFDESWGVPKADR
jgi:hypothetical protein